ncbi:bifunctional glutamine synthetase adenylyltransferase/deadenyltransferase [Ventosimonas gracilis]|uniref:Bifunctional glutamine synthetase adenylyltransferase/adenylyl-removing enzyme n=1 Tax=Ventosimonas gracilis TaxID=1680762 RepID=A0A139SVG1_9GAMM|nr:bifunctional [glutamate--ammonia ligase]-adenylyl-L-tyrosine phosphorylase/[glutamate--ammonia-ligase] adenylyltransferase [Ventosimonas gracilis]KXU38450.1 bifunctional glutamine synthetase adenylyltransferase/deadenyltransferase [Ventosimonas gracilis]
MSLPLLRALPDDLGEQACRADRLLADARLAAWPDERQSALQWVCALSDFAFEQVQRDPEQLLQLAETGELERPRRAGELRTLLSQQLKNCTDETQLAHCLRRFRNREQLRIVWRELNRLADLAETCRDLSQLADTTISLAADFLYRQQIAQFGTPIGKQSGKEQQLLVLGMGKLGAEELNLSSDIDLIFAYPQSGETHGGKRSIDNQEFFTKLGQKLIKALDAITVDGFVFRVDMRLRPYGSSGPLVFSFNALEQYYQTQGRDWERYALIKARVVAGDNSAGRALLKLLRPFVFRRYLDYSAIEALRDMKRLIEQEVRRRELQDNIKLGAGGIREVEFIAQAFQLIHGGRNLALQQRALLDVLAVLEKQGYLPAKVIRELKDGYRFLRYVEHGLQAIADQQTHALPDDEVNRARLACLMGFADWTSFMRQLGQWRTRIDQHFRAVIAAKDDETESADESGQWLPLWLGRLPETSAQAQLGEAGFSQAQTAWQQLMALRESSAVRAMQSQGRQRLDALMPRLLAQIVQQDRPGEVLERVLPLVGAIARRSVYLLLLCERPDALNQLLELCAKSPWIAAQMARYPLLLDELLQGDKLYQVPRAPQLAAELQERLLRIPADDLEQQMEALRHFKLAHSLRVVTAELGGTLPLMKVSDYLTWLAEAILEQVLHLAWQQCVARHGRPKRLDGGRSELDFVIIGYGKLGGLELSHSSDLDLVFLHDGDPNASTDGDKPVDGAQFFMRLGQRILHLLTTNTASGALYEVDMRLRPSGASGLLVSSLAAFARYQSESAWTWEHQALLRARVLAGSEQLGAAFEQVRQRVLSRPRDKTKLAAEVSDMRRKMRENLGTRSGGQGFDLKQDVGGIVDIEFIVQYAALAFAYQHPDLLRWTDCMRLLDELGSSALFSAEDAHVLQSIYKSYRSKAHQLALQQKALRLADDAFASERREVIRLWHELGLN